jgi:hypothetical protein
MFFQLNFIRLEEKTQFNSVKSYPAPGFNVLKEVNS